MKRLIVKRSFFAINRHEPFEPGPTALDPADPVLQADLAANNVSFEQFASHLVEQDLAQWSEEE